MSNLLLLSFIIAHCFSQKYIVIHLGGDFFPVLFVAHYCNTTLMCVLFRPASVQREIWFQQQNVVPIGQKCESLRRESDVTNSENLCFAACTPTSRQTPWTPDATRNRPAGFGWFPSSRCILATEDGNRPSEHKYDGLDNWDYQRCH